MKTIFIFLSLIKLIFIKTEILNVVELNRHGARTPNNYPDESSKLFFGSKDMQLTINGYRQHQLLGQFVRNKYINKNKLLNTEYDKSEFEAISTPTQRTIFSTAGFLSGIYPDYVMKMKYEHDNKMKVDDLFPGIENLGDLENIKEIQIKVVDGSEDSFFHGIRCKYDGKALEDHLEDENNNQIFEISEKDQIHTMNQLKELLNLNNNPNQTLFQNLEGLSKFYSSQLYHFNNDNKNKTLDDKALNIIKRLTLNRWYNTRSINSNKYLRLTSSEYFNKILNNFEAAIESFESKQPKKIIKYLLLSGHDTMIVNILALIHEQKYLNEILIKAADNDEMFNFLVPPYASNLFFELHYDEDIEDYFVSIIYNGKSVTEGLYSLKEEDFKSEKIQYSKFVSMLEGLINKDYSKLDCSENNKSKRSKNKSLKKNHLRK